MANSDGGTILVGVEDDGRISGIKRDITNVRPLEERVTDYCEPQSARPNVGSRQIDGVAGQSVLLLTVQPQTEPCYTKSGAILVRDDLTDGSPTNRRLDPEEAAQFLISRHQVTFESAPVSSAQEHDLNEEHIVEHALQQGWDQSAIRTEMIRRGLAVDQSGGFVPTNVGILLFGTNPTLYMGRSDIDFVRFEGTEMKVGGDLNVIKRATFEGALPDAISSAIEFVRGQIRERTPLVNSLFESTPEYPEPAWIEAIVNAVAHRDYSVKSQPLFVRMFDDRLEVESPGGVVSPNTVQGLTSGDYSHHSRNPRLVRTLYDMGFMRRLGEGIRRMIQEMQRYALSPPAFHELSGSFKVTLYNTAIFAPATMVWLRQFEDLNISELQRRALAHAFEEGYVTNRQLRESIGVSRDIVFRELRRLSEIGLIKPRRAGPGAEWILA